ncbi:MAG: hypothetical protein IJD32_04415 [Bacteroidaceae bacterium]|nr:hypothetical protein [Bacteroidaceae bacterium]
MYLKKIVQRYFSFILIQKKIHIFYLTTWFFISFPRTKLKPHGFSFLLNGLRAAWLFISFPRRKETKQRKFAGCIFWPTPALFYAKQKELASLKQLFVFNAPKSTSASRPKNKAESSGVDVYINIASLVIVNVFMLRVIIALCVILSNGKDLKTSTSTSVAMLSSPLEKPAFVEEREEIPVFFREDRKAV